MMMTANLEIISAPLSDTGLQRSGNEDSCLIAEPNMPQMLVDSGRLYIVADGVGGAAYGERASRLAAETVQREYYRHTTLEPGERLRRAIEAANRVVYDEAQRSGGRRMATTMVAAAVLNGYLSVAWVGDSRAYLIRNGAPMQITEDHSLVQQMVRRGEMTEAEAEVSNIRNRLLRSVGGDEDVLVDVIAQDLPLQADDTLVLCTDGLTKYADGEQIARLIDEHPEESAQRLVDFALRSGGADNITVIVARVVGPRHGSHGAMIPLVSVPSGSAAVLDEELIETQGISGTDRQAAGLRRRRMPPIPPALEQAWDGLGRKVHWLILISLVCVVLAAGTMLAAILSRVQIIEAPVPNALANDQTQIAIRVEATTAAMSIPILGAESETPLPAMTTAIPPVIETPPVVPPVAPVVTTDVPVVNIPPQALESQAVPVTSTDMPDNRVCTYLVKDGDQLQEILIKSYLVQFKYFHKEGPCIEKTSKEWECNGKPIDLPGNSALKYNTLLFTLDLSANDGCPFKSPSGNITIVK